MSVQQHDLGAKDTEEIFNLKRKLTFNNRYVACETFTLHEATDPIDDDDDDRSRDG